MTGYKSKRAAAQDKLAMTKTEALRIALDALELVMSHGQAVKKAKDILAEALAQPERPWVGMTKGEILSIIDQQEAYTQTGLPMFYRDQCLEMAKIIETTLKERNA